ncbi:MAG: inositol-3-phosphate synthase [Balneola sp.]|jgi:myo-inositol-1-phosphate synthase|nr:inositol-3-phosphate synthase [Balneola sp.]MBE79860.1 inositol-3-phosphate synthase [Balneola sp.]|tara:strand:- start:657 stop:1976 length:1320 start_codon:yes stop_codon:yes gene_type:complete
MSKTTNQSAADGKLLVLTPGMGAVATTFIAGVESIRKGLSKPIGSLTQMQTIRLGARSENRSPLIKDFLPLADLNDLEFGGWDVKPDNVYDACVHASVLKPQDLEPISEFLKTIKPMSAAFEQKYVKKLEGPNVKDFTTKKDLAEQLREDIRNRMEETGASRAVMVWCGSTEVYQSASECHMSIEAFEKGLEENDEAIAPSQLYAYAAIMEGVPYANGAPNLSADIPALTQLAEQKGVPIAGKDFKTGQTLMKTILAPGFKTRMLGIRGWFSTNILGNRDGEVLDDPESFKSKEVTKSGVLDTILQPDTYKDLYKDLYHKVRINYYPPRGDEKEGWDNIDIFGWMSYPMQIKVDFLCRDSILAAPIVLDLALFLDLAKRNGKAGIQEWLSFYFKSPQVEDGHVQEHDIFIQHFRLKNTLRVMGGEEPVTHLSENYDSYK